MGCESLGESRCSICPRDKRLVPGDGPKPATYMAIGEAPGKDEDRLGIPFVGQSGQEQNETYFRLAGLERGEVYVTNVRKCRPPNNRTPASKEIVACGNHHLPQEISEVQPSVIF